MECAIGIDLGGTSIKFALINRSGDTYFENTIPSKANISKEAVILQLSKAIKELFVIAKSKGKRIIGIGIGTPGIIDKTERIVLGGAENIKEWENLPLANILEEEFKLPTIIANDANMMGIGEAIYGAAKGYENVVFLTIGTGIGGAIIIGGKLFNGFDNRGTELGHVPFIANGKHCECGSQGCLEAYASTSALIKDFSNQYKGKEKINGKLIVKLYKEGNPIAIKCFEQHCDYLGHGIAGFINIFSPQKIVIGGGLSEAGSFYIKKITQRALHYAMRDCAVNTDIIAAKLGNRAGYMGAAAAVFEKISGHAHKI